MLGKVGGVLADADEFAVRDAQVLEERVDERVNQVFVFFVYVEELARNVVVVVV
jgi:hypothetical protein